MVDKVKIASRKSDLAKWQAYAVGEALVEAYPGLQVEYLFSASAGDKDQDRLLTAFGDKGAFTQDFYRGLVEGEFDIVVHSWKDLPIEERDSTEIVGTLPRADQRDLLVFKKSEIPKLREEGVLVKVLSSSPRRAYNLEPFLKKALPGQSDKQICFEPVRGNVQTRFRKLMEGEAQGLVVAKAALDRLLSSSREEFVPTQSLLREYLSQCQIVVLPLCANPTAPGQGALAIEVNKKNVDLKKMIEKINHPPTFQGVSFERQVLKSHGGGCHQKIGASVISFNEKVAFSLKGLTEAGQVLDQFHLDYQLEAPPQGVKEEDIFPDPQHSSKAGETQWGIRREDLGSNSLLRERLEKEPDLGLFVARSNALPEGFGLRRSSPLWCSGIESWFKLAKKGYWVNGCSEGLGHFNSESLETLMGRHPWVKLTHDKGVEEPDLELMFTYKLNETHLKKEELTQCLKDKKYFFWMSYSHFKRAVDLVPEVVNGTHYCGPGQTLRLLEKELGAKKVKPHVSYKKWVQWILQK